MGDFQSGLSAALVLGIGATAVMDVWGFARRPLLGVAPPNYCLVGRWFGHMPRGRFRHPAIAAAKALRGECLVGWVAHYLTGIAFAGLLVILSDPSWTDPPRFTTALAVGLGTLAAPFLLMQPGMGAGIASSKATKPWSARLHSLITHVVFACGLYVSGVGYHALFH